MQMRGGACKVVGDESLQVSGWGKVTTGMDST